MASAMQSAAMQADQELDPASPEEPTPDAQRIDYEERVKQRLEHRAQAFARNHQTGFEGLDSAVEYAMMRAARLMGGAMITILLIAVVLNEVFGAVNVGSGPFSEIGTDLRTTGVAAIGLLVVGLIVFAANRLMGIFGGNGGM